MRLRLEFPNRIPYGGYWRYIQPGTGQSISAVTWDNLLNNIRDHRKANGIPVGLGFEEEVEQAVCREHPDECVGYDETCPRKKNLTLSDIVAGTRVMMSFFASGRKLVSREEAERRAQICLKCPYNMTFSKPCSGVCPELKSVVMSITDSVGTQYDSKLNSCTVCGCFLQAAIWMPLENQCKGVNELQKKQFSNAEGCWKQCGNL